ncbi:MAG: DUF1571 domain-containing protein [Spirochaetota bacterium]|nr:DUF1571 domain-containing protein [Spirochaetota bacterium]
MHKIIFKLSFILLFIFVSGEISGGSDVSEEFKRRINKGLQFYNSVDSYQYTLQKKEWLGLKYIDQTILFKFKKPFKVYLKVLKGEDKGSQVIYIKGWNSGEARVKTRFFTFNLDPGGSLMLSTNRHPLFEVGLGNILTGTLQDIVLGQQNGDMTLTYLGKKTVGLRTSHAYEIIFPVSKSKRGRRTMDRKPGQYYAPRVQLWLDTKNSLPLRFRIWDRYKRLVEDYIHTDLRLNHLTDLDFNPIIYKF